MTMRSAISAVLFIVPVLCGAQAPSPQAAQALGAFDALMKDAEEAALGLEQLRAAFSGGPEACVRTLPVKAALDLIGGGGQGPAAEELVSRAMSLYICRAYVARTPAPCDDLKKLKLGGDMPNDQLCRDEYRSAIITTGRLTRRPEFVELCKTMKLDGVRPASQAAVCSALVTGSAESCAQLQSAFIDAKHAANCPGLLREFSGDPSLCQGETMAYARELCLGYAAFKKAGAGAPEACGRSAVCRMMAEPTSCGSFEGALRASMCAPAWAEKLTPAPRKEIEDMFVKARGLLLLAESAGTGTPGQAVEVDRRAEKLSRVKWRYQRATAVSRGAPAAAPPRR